MNTSISEILLKYNAVQVSLDQPFTWTSGIKSPIYCDNRILISIPEARDFIINAFQEKIREKNITFDVIGGTSTAAIPWAAFLAQVMQKPMVYIRPQPKGHGQGKQVEGVMEKNSKVIIIEDLFSTGGSAVGSAQACEREYDASIVAIGSIFTYEFPMCAQKFKECSYDYFSLDSFSNLVSMLSLSDGEKQTILRFTQNPKEWESTL